MGGHLGEAAEGVSEAHVGGSVAFGLEESRIADDNGAGASAGGGDVEAIERVEELHAVRDVLLGGSGEGVDHNGGLLALEFVDGADANVGDALRKIEDLQIVGRDDHDFVVGQRFEVVPAVFPANSRLEQAFDDASDDLDFFGRGVSVLRVGHGDEPEAG